MSIHARKSVTMSCKVSGREGSGFAIFRKVANHVLFCSLERQ